MQTLKNNKDVTPQWLTKVLQAGGYLTEGTVTDIELEFSESNHGKNADITLRYSDGAVGEMPAFLFLKHYNGNNFNQAEATYYTEVIAGISPPIAPHCYYAHRHPNQHGYTLLLQNVSQTHQINWDIPPTYEAYTNVVATMARLHAKWWQHPNLANVGQHPTPAKLAKLYNHAQQGLDPLLNAIGTDISAEWREQIKAIFAGILPAMQNRAAKKNALTFIHGDTNMGNILTPKNGTGHTYLIDHQPFDFSLTIWLGAFDLAYPMGLFWKTEARRTLEKPLLTHYHQTLLNLGIENYTFADLWHDYRLCLLQQLFTPADWCIDPTERQEMGWLWQAQLKRVLTACHDLNCFALL